MTTDADTRNYFRHPLAVVESTHIGVGTRIWAFAHVLPGAQIGRDCNVCDHVFIENDVIVGDRVTVKSGVQLWDGVVLEDDVFVGPNATFTNDSFPRSKHRPQSILRTVIESRASIGANATILPGVRVGQNAMVGAGSVVTGNVPANAIVMGNPARITGYDVADSHRGEITDLAEPQVSPHRAARGRVRTIRSAAFEDLRGSLAVLEHSALPFVPQRTFTVFAVPSDEVRGEHALRRCEQVLTCVSGSVRITWHDGVDRGTILLDSPYLSVYVPQMVWCSQSRFTSDAVLLGLASHAYDENDYIRRYDEFLSAASNLDEEPVA